MSLANHDLLEPYCGISFPFEMMEGLMTAEVGFLSDPEGPCLQLPQTFPDSVTGTEGLPGHWEHSGGPGQDLDSASDSSSLSWT